MNTLAHARALLCAAILAVSLLPRLIAVEQLADSAWGELQAAVFTPDTAQPISPDPVARRLVAAERVSRLIATADRAKAFYTGYPQHTQAGEARKYEVLSLVSAVQAGASEIEGRLVATVVRPT